MRPFTCLVNMHKAASTLRHPEKRVLHYDIFTRNRRYEFEDCCGTRGNIYSLFIPDEVFMMPLIDLVEDRTDDMPVGTFIRTSIHKEKTNSVSLIRTDCFAKSIMIEILSFLDIFQADVKFMK